MFISLRTPSVSQPLTNGTAFSIPADPVRSRTLMIHAQGGPVHVRTDGIDADIDTFPHIGDDQSVGFEVPAGVEVSLITFTTSVTVWWQHVSVTS